MFIGYCTGQFVGPQIFIAKESPNYPTAFRTFYSAVSMMIVLEIVLLQVLPPYVLENATDNIDVAESTLGSKIIAVTRRRLNLRPKQHGTHEILI